MRNLRSILFWAIVWLCVLPRQAMAQAGFVSNTNSTTTALAGNGVFTGVSEDVSGFQAITVTVFANQASAANGLSVQFSPDNSNWDVNFGYGILASVVRTVQVPVQARYFRIVYTNGASAQTAFRLQTIYEAAPTSNDRATSQQIVLQPSLTSGITNATTTRQITTGLDVYTDVDILINITGGGAATGTLNLFIQDSVDGGTTWDDLAAAPTFTFGSAATTMRFTLAGKVAGITNGGAVSTDALTQGTSRAGPFGNQFRVREKVSGVAGSPTGVTYTINAVFKR